MVGMYEPYVEVCRRLAELYPGPGDAYKSVLLNSGAEAVENAVKIARAATGRPAVIAFDRAFHGRTLLTMSLTSKVVPYKRGFGPFAPEVYRAPAPYESAASAPTTRSTGCGGSSRPTSTPRAWPASCSSRCRARAASSRCRSTSRARLQELCAAHGILYVDDEVQAGVGRTGPVWAIEHYGVEPDLLVSGKSLGGGLPLAAVTGRAELMDAVAPRRARRHVRRQPGRLRGRGGRARHRRVAGFRAPRRASSGATLRARLDAIAAELDVPSATCAGSGRCSRSSSRDGAPAPADRRVVAAARERGPAAALLRARRQRDPAAAAGHDRATTSPPGSTRWRARCARCVGD